MGHNPGKTYLLIFIIIYAALYVVILSEVISENGDLLYGEHGKFWCPSRCTCSLQEHIIDCSSLQLKEIPIVPISTQRLYLHSNLITELAQERLQSLHRLSYLILSGNMISQIQDGVFMGMKMLKYFHVATYLSSHGGTGSVMMSYDITKCLRRIFDSNNITSLSSTAFRDITSIETISLARNRLKSISSQTFSHNKQAMLINLQGNLLRHVDKDSFRGLHNLITLNLEDNLLDESVFQSLQEHPRLVNLRLNGNKIKSLLPDGLDLPTLKHLNLHSNSINFLPGIILKNCSSLETIVLSNNKIEDVSDNSFNGCHKIMKIQLQNNRLKTISLKTFADLSSIRDIFLGNNQLMGVAVGTFQGLSALVTLHLEKNEISFLKKKTFMDLYHLESIYLHHNLISHIEPGTFHNLPRLKKILLHKNALLTVSPTVFLSLHSLQRLQMDALKCSCGLLPLAQQFKSQNVLGVHCIREGGNQLYAINKLVEYCAGLKGSYLHKGQLMKDSSSIKASHQDDSRRSAPGIPRGPSIRHPHYHGTDLKERITKLEYRVSHLTYQLSRLEALNNMDSSSCDRIVCVSEGVRFIAGDKWRHSDGKECLCEQGLPVKLLP